MAKAQVNFDSLGGGGAITPTLFARTNLWGYHDAGQSYTAQYTIDTSKHYLINIVRSGNAIGNATYRSAYTEGTSVIDIDHSASDYNLLNITIDGTLLKFDLYYSRDFYNVVIFQLD